MSVFLDTNIIIYLIEQTPVFGLLAANRVQSLIGEGERLVVSDLVRMECRVRPLRTNDEITLSAFDGYFASDDVEVIPVTGAVCNRAAAIRATYRLSPMDSLHLAAAVEHGCRLFLTQDSRLEEFRDIAIEILS